MVARLAAERGDRSWRSDARRPARLFCQPPPGTRQVSGGERKGRSSEPRPATWLRCPGTVMAVGTEWEDVGVSPTHPLSEPGPAGSCVYKSSLAARLFL